MTSALPTPVQVATCDFADSANDVARNITNAATGAAGGNDNGASGDGNSE